MPPLFDLARRPVQPLIPELDVKGWRAEYQQGHPLALIFGDIPQHSPDSVGVFEIMFGDQFLIKSLPLGVLDEANDDCLQQQRLWRSSGNGNIEKVNRHAASRANPNRERQQKLLTPYPSIPLPHSLSAALAR